MIPEPLMQAIVQTAYGAPEKVLEIRGIRRPVPGPDDVRVHVCAASVHPDVWHTVTGRPQVLRLMGAGLLRPKQRTPGTDLAGYVEAVGENVARLRPGDEVFGEALPRMAWANGGTYAEYAVAPADNLALKPQGVTFEEAATVPTSGLITLYNMRREWLRPGRRILVNGAGGAVGSIAVQLAKNSGARVTGADLPEKLELVRYLGADRVLEAGRDELADDGDGYDLILDVASTLTLARAKPLLAPTGLYIFIGHDHYGRGAGRLLGSLPRALALLARSRFDSHLPYPVPPAPTRRASMLVLQGLLAAKRLTPVVHSTYPLNRVPEALHRLAEDNPVGRLVITP